jgi:hypothetical protein
MRKAQTQNIDKRFYTPRAVERKMYEDDVDAVLVEGLSFHRFDPKSDKDIVDTDPQRSGELLARHFGLNSVEFLGIGKKKKSKEERKERREERREDIRKVFNQVKDKVGDIAENIGDKIGDVKENVKDAAKDVKADPIKALKKGIHEVAHTVIKGAYAVPRSAYLGLIAANFRGFATRIAYADQATKEKIKKDWSKFGGDGDTLMNVANKAKDQKAVTCGVKCKAKVYGMSKSSFDGQIFLESMTYHGLVGGDDIAVAMATATPVIAAVSKALEAAKPGVESAAAIKKALDEVKNDDVNDELARKQMPDKQRKAIDNAFKEAITASDPVNQIKNNPNLTDDEKKAAIALLNPSWSTKKKVLVFGGIAVGLAGLIFLVVKSGSSATTSSAPAATN